MTIVKIYGGLGNQMFQYAFSRELAARRGEDIRLDTSAYARTSAHNGYELPAVFGLDGKVAAAADCRRLATAPDNLAQRLRRKYLTKSTHHIDRRFGFDPAVFDYSGDRYFEGYWQSEKYFPTVAAEIAAGYRFKAVLAAQNAALLERIPRPAASVHVRRGDFLKSENQNVCTPRYFNAAMAELAAVTGCRAFLVFSDDPAWCRAELRTPGAVLEYVDWNRGGDSWQDMALMARCDHNIIANSSFSWWGAWLNPNPDKIVIAPTPWNMRELRRRDRYYSYSFDDIVPAAWRRLPA